MAVNLTTFHENLKKGWTQSDFEHEFQMTSEQFLKFVKKSWPCNYKKILRTLKKNTKLANRISKNQSSCAPIALAPEFANDFLESVATESLEQIWPRTVQTPVEESIPVSEAGVHSSRTEDNPATSSPTPVFPNVEELRSIANTLNLQIHEQEVRRTKLLSDCKNLMSSLQQKTLELTPLKAQVGKLEEEVDEITEQLNILNDDLNTVNIELSSMTEELSEINVRIAEMEKIFIYVYPDGEIKVENYDTEISSVDNLDFTQFLTDTRFEDFTLKETKQLARLIAFTKSLQEQKLVFEVIFESQALKEVWETLD